MRWPGFLGAAWHGGVRSETCPFCRFQQAVPRQAIPFSILCKNCGKVFQVTKSGVIAGRAKDH